jgi:hypothetical protein
MKRDEEALNVFTRASELFPGHAFTLKNLNAAVIEVKWRRREGPFGGVAGFNGMMAGVSLLTTTVLIAILLFKMLPLGSAALGLGGILVLWLMLVISSESFFTRPILLWMFPCISWN